ncbi:MAG: hypothetical protein U0325_28380 [Polyangiales bacterium]
MFDASFVDAQNDAAQDIVDASAVLDVRADVSRDDVPDGAVVGDASDVVATPQTGRTCAEALPLDGDASRPAEDPSMNPAVTSCGGPSNVARQHYALTVPAGRRVTLVATPLDRSARLDVRVLNACGQGGCYANGGSATDGAAVSVFIDNPAGTAMRVQVNVSGGRYALTTTSAPLDAGLACALPRTLAPGATLTDQDPTAAGPDPACRYARGLWYDVTIPAGHRAVVSARSEGGVAQLSAQATCGRVSCGTSGENVGGYTTVITRDNATSAPVTWHVHAFATGRFRIAAASAPILGEPYVVTRVPTDCVDFAALPGGATATTLSGPEGDNNLSPVTPLGFSFQLAGDLTPFETMTHAQMSSDGYLVLQRDGATVAAAITVDTVGLPNPQSPNALVAPFRDDLHQPGTTEPTGGRVVTLGVAPARTFVAEWFGRSFVDCCGVVGNNTARLRFQAKLFETTHVIEFHYCELAVNSAPASRVTGGAAAVGVESPLGTRGTQAAYRTAGAVTTTQGYRLTPTW